MTRLAHSRSSGLAKLYLAALTAGVALLAAACSATPADHHRSGATQARPARRASTSAGPFGTSVRSAMPVMPVSHSGRWLVDATGRVLEVHGVNMVEKRAPYYPAAFGFDSADGAWLAANGFDVVRLGVLATGALPAPGVVDSSYIDHLASTVRMLQSYGIMVLLDAHQDGYGPSVGSDGFPAWMTLTDGAQNTHVGFPDYYVADPAVQQAFQSFWKDQAGPGGEGLQQDDASMFRALAQKFASSENILGYEILNEPWPGTTWLPCATGSGCPALDRSELDPFYARIDRAIRSADHAHLVFAEPFVLFNLGTSKTSISLPGGDPDSGMAFHVYPTDPSNAVDVIDNAVSWSRSTGGALLATEWGATTSPAAIEVQEAAFDSSLMPWLFWSFNVSMVKSISAPPTGSNLHRSAVAALVEPHPLAVAGTPRTLSYDHASHVLHFSWSTSRVGGGSFPPGAVTSIQVPKLAEENGYRVQVTGGKVTSPPCSTMLSIVALSGAKEVSVTIHPAATGTKCATASGAS